MLVSICAVANSALINMMMASRLLYGMSRQAIVPAFLARVHARNRSPYAAIVFTTLLASALITYVSFVSDDAVAVLGGTTALLLLAVFAVVNVAVRVLRKDRVAHHHFAAETPLCLIGAISCLYLVTPLSGRDVEQYRVAGLLLGVGVILWAPLWLPTGRYGRRAPR